MLRAAGLAARARTGQLAPLQRLAHRRFASDEVGELLVRAELVEALARARGEAQSTWREARERRDAAPFLPARERLAELPRALYDALGYAGHPCDALLAAREPGLTAAFLDDLLACLRAEQVPLLAALAAAPDPAASAPDPLAAELEPRRVFDFTVELLAAVGFDFRRGRQDYSVHPFTTAFSPDDVRLTPLHRAARGRPRPVRPGRRGVRGHPLCGRASGGVHEFQSRLWENLAGRSRPFWRWLAPRLR